MSTDWRLRCMTCDSRMENHYDMSRSEAREIFADLDRIADVYEASRSLAVNVRFVTTIGDRQFDADWCRQHRGHEVVVESECGDRDDECSKRVPCAACKHDGRCRRDPGHDGTCSLEKES